MRTLLKVTFDAASGNRPVRDGTVGKIIGTFTERFKPEASHFLADSGERTALFVFNLEDPSQIPEIAEPFFTNLNARVDLKPVMNRDELGKGLHRILRSQ